MVAPAYVLHSTVADKYPAYIKYMIHAPQCNRRYYNAAFARSAAKRDKAAYEHARSTIGIRARIFSGFVSASANAMCAAAIAPSETKKPGIVPGHFGARSSVRRDAKQGCRNWRLFEQLLYNPCGERRKNFSCFCPRHAASESPWAPSGPWGRSSCTGAISCACGSPLSLR
jgi:hypothetical protein